MKITRSKLIRTIKWCMLSGAFAASLSMQAQDVHVSQFYSTPILVNPAMTGIFDGKVRITNNYKAQWGADGYKTINISLDLPFGKSRLKNNYFGGGLMIYNDNAGSSKFTHTIIEGALAYTISVDDGDNFLSIGFRGGIDSREVDFSRSTWDNQWNGDVFDPSIPGESPQLLQRTYFDFTAGLMWYYIPDGNNTICLGGSMSHITTPDLSFFTPTKDLLNARIAIHGSAELAMDANSTFWVAPKILVQLQGNQNEIVPGTFLKTRLQLKSKYTNYRKDFFLSYGAWYRLGDAIIFAARLDYNEFGLGLSYDITTSEFSSLTGHSGGPEFTLSYIPGIKRGQRTKHFNKMPKFF